MTGFASPGFAHPGFAGNALGEAKNYLRRLARKITTAMGHEAQPRALKTVSAAASGSEPAVAKLSDAAVLAGSDAVLDKVSTAAADGIGVSLRQTTVDNPVLEIGNLVSDPTLANGLQFFGDLAGANGGVGDYEVVAVAGDMATIAYSGGVSLWRVGPAWVPVVPGQRYACSFDYATPNGSGFSSDLTAYVAFMREGVWTPGASQETSFSPGSSLPHAAELTRASLVAVCPADCTLATIAFWANTYRTVVFVANLMIDPRGAVADFADGDSPGWVWQGAPSASPSGIVTGHEQVAVSALAQPQLVKTQVLASAGLQVVANKVQSEASRV